MCIRDRGAVGDAAGAVDAGDEIVAEAEGLEVREGGQRRECG